MVNLGKRIGKSKIIRIFGIPVYESIKISGRKNRYYIGLGKEVHKKGLSKDKIRDICAKYKNCKKEILVVFTDSIGDYILFRNFLYSVKNSDKYKDYNIVLLCSNSYYEFAKYLDSDIISEFIKLPNKKGQKLKDIKNELYKSNLKSYYDTIIYPSINSVWMKNMYNDILSDVVFNENIIYRYDTCDEISCKEFLKYTHVYVNYNDRELFIFDMYKEFFQDLLDEKIDINYPFIESNKVDYNYELINNNEKKYIVINPCARDNYRMWHRHNYMALFKYIKNEMNLDIVIVCGGESEKNYCEELVKDSGINDIKIYSSLLPKDLLSLLKMSKLYIGQDSGVFHIAAALDIKALCISAGNAYFHFMNYPEYRKNIKILRPAGVIEWIERNKDEDSEMINSVDSFYINQIKVKDVIDGIKQLS